MENPKKNIISITILVGIASFFSPSIQIAIQGAVNMIASGRSPVRIYLILVWFLVLFILPKKNRDLGVFKRNLPVLSLGVTFLIGAITQIWFTYSHDLSWKAYSILIHGNEMTSTGLSHNHFGKSIIGPIFSFISNRFETFDPGIGIAAFTPFVFELTLLISILVCVYSLIQFVRNSITSLSNEDTTLLRKICAFTIVSFMSLKVAVDGGFFATHGVLSLGLLYALTRNNSRQFWNISTSALMAQFLLYALLYWSGLYIEENTPLLFALQSLGSYCLVSWLVGPKHIKETDTARVPRFGINKIVLVGFIAILGISIANSLSILSYRGLPADQSIIASYNTNVPDSFKRKGSIGEINLYVYTGEKTVGDIIESEHMLDNLYPVSVPWKTCLPLQPAQEISFDIQSTASLANVENKNVRIYLDLIKSQTSENTWSGRLFVPACTPRIVSILTETLREAGATHAIISNIHGI